MNPSSPSPLNMTQADIDSIRRQIEQVNSSEVFAEYLKRTGYEGAKLRFDEDEEHLKEVVAEGLDYPIILLTRPGHDGRETTVCSFEVNLVAQPSIGNRPRTVMTFQPEVSVLSSPATRNHPEEWDMSKLGQPDRSLGGALQTFLVESFKDSLAQAVQAEGEANWYKESEQAAKSLHSMPLPEAPVHEGQFGVSGPEIGR